MGGSAKGWPERAADSSPVSIEEETADENRPAIDLEIHLYGLISSSKLPPPESSTVFSDNFTIQGPRVQTHGPEENTPHSSHGSRVPPTATELMMTGER